MSDRVKIDFYFDVASVYTFLAWFVLKQYINVWNLEIIFKPVFLPGIMKETGNIPPATLPRKAQFLHMDTIRTAKWYGIDSSFQATPTNFFSESVRENVKVQRLIAAATASDSISQSTLFNIIDTAFTAFWIDKRNRDANNNLSHIDDSYISSLCIAAGLSSSQTAELVAQSQSVGKDLLKTNTDEAVSLGCFGSPNFLIHSTDAGNSKSKHLFFGSDRFEQMAFFLGKKWLGPLAKLSLFCVPIIIETMSDFALQTKAAYQVSMASYLHEQAAFYAQRLLSESPGNPEALFMLGEALYRSGELTRAHYYLNQAVEQLKPEGRYLLGKVCSELGQWEEAYRVLEPNSASHAPSIYLLGICLERLDRPTEAADAFARCLQISPIMWAAFTRFSALAPEASKTTVATERFAAGIFTEEGVGQTTVKLGDAGKRLVAPKLAPPTSVSLTRVLQGFGAALHANHLREGPAAMNAILGKLPKIHAESPLGRGLLAQAYNDSGEYLKAETQLVELCKVDPLHTCSISTAVPSSENCSCCNYLEIHSSVLWQLRRELEIAQLAARALNLRRTNAATWVTLGNCFSLQKDNDAAVKFFRRATQICPNHPSAYALLGLEFAAREKLDKAQEAFSRAVALQPRNYVAWWGQGNVLMSQEEFSSAYAHYSRAAELNRHSSALQASLGVAAAALSSPADARTHFSAAAAMNPENVFALYNCGQIDLSQGKLESARDYLEKAKALAPKEPAVHFLLGKVFAANGEDPNKALCAFDAALDLHKESKDQHIVRQSIEALQPGRPQAGSRLSIAPPVNTRRTRRPSSSIGTTRRT